MINVNSLAAADVDQELIEYFWANLGRCGRDECHYRACAKNNGIDPEKFFGHKKTIFGKKFDNMCWHIHTKFPLNPDKKHKELIKRTMLYRRKALILASK